jgi:hypothetical protein
VILNYSAEDFIPAREVAKPAIIIDAPNQRLDHIPLEYLPRLADSIISDTVGFEVLTNCRRSAKESQKPRPALPLPNAGHEPDAESIRYGIKSERIDRHFTCRFRLIEQRQSWK